MGNGVDATQTFSQQAIETMRQRIENSSDPGDEGHITMMAASDLADTAGSGGVPRTGTDAWVEYVDNLYQHTMQQMRSEGLIGTNESGQSIWLREPPSSRVGAVQAPATEPQIIRGAVSAAVDLTGGLNSAADGRINVSWTVENGRIRVTSVEVTRNFTFRGSRPTSDQVQQIETRIRQRLEHTPPADIIESGITSGSHGIVFAAIDPNEN